MTTNGFTDWEDIRRKLLALSEKLDTYFADIGRKLLAFSEKLDTYFADIRRKLLAFSEKLDTYFADMDAHEVAMDDEAEKAASSGQERFAKFADRRLSEILNTLVMKGQQYSPDDWSATSNFDQGCVAIGLSPEHYLMALANKQWYVLCQWAAGKRTGTKYGEIRERAEDVIVYLLLLLWMSSKDQEGR